MPHLILTPTPAGLRYHLDGHELKEGDLIEIFDRRAFELRGVRLPGRARDAMRHGSCPWAGPGRSARERMSAAQSK